MPAEGSYVVCRFGGGYAGFLGLTPTNQISSQGQSRWPLPRRPSSHSKSVSTSSGRLRNGLSYAVSKHRSLKRSYLRRVLRMRFSGTERNPACSCHWT